LREYVLVSQHERRIDAYRREGSGWYLDDFGPGERVRLTSIEVALSVDEIYTDALGPIVG
jgi:sensor c-di-GMP phosphodiesterase-like protein